MDYLDWDCYPATSSWGDHEVAEAYNGVRTADHITCTTEPPSHQLEYYPNPEKILSQMVQHLAPSPDSITVASNPSYPLSQTEAIIISEDPLELPLRKRPYNVVMENALSGLMANFGMPYKENSTFKSTAPLESLDYCLLSATNSNTDASGEDDGINSIFFSDTGCRNVVSKFNFSGANKDEISQNFGGKFSSSLGLISSNPQPQSKKRRVQEKAVSSSNISFKQPSNHTLSGAKCLLEEADTEAMAQMKEMIYRATAFRPMNFSDEVVEKPKRKNVKISSDPQTVAARQRREKISEKMRVLQRLVPGGSKMDTARMLEEAANYVSFLRTQVKELETLGQKLHFARNAKHPAVAPFSMRNNYQ